MSEVSVDVKENKIVAGLDANKDGEASVKLNINLKEVLEELRAKGEAKIEGKKVSLKFELTKLKVLVDTDGDGEPIVALEVDLGESYEEFMTK